MEKATTVAIESPKNHDTAFYRETATVVMR